jgi:hypothetical protein
MRFGGTRLVQVTAEQPVANLSMSADHAAAFTLWPHDAGHTAVTCDFLFHPDETTRDDFDPGDAVAFWDLVNELGLDGLLARAG